MIYFSHYLLFSVFHSWYLQEVLIKLVLVVVVEGSGFLGLGEGLAGFLAVLFPPTDVVPGPGGEKRGEKSWLKEGMIFAFLI